MSNVDVIAMSIANAYTDESLKGGGAVKGKNCTISKKEAIEGGTKITFAWYLDDGTEETTTLNVMDGQAGATGADGQDGVSVASFEVDGTNLIVVLSDGSKSDPIPIPTVKGETGDDGFSPVITVKTNTDSRYVLHIKTADDEFDTPNLKGGGSGGDAELSDDLTSAVSVGGIDIGTTYEAGTPLETVLRDMLEPTLYPTYVAPSASLSYSSDANVEVKSTISAKTATLTYSAGAININGTKQANRGGEATNYALASSGADTEYSASGASGSFNVSALTRSTKGSIVLTGTVSYAQGAQPKDSKGNDYGEPLPSGTVTASKTINFIQPYFYGASNSSSVADFTGLTKSVTTKGQKTFAFTTNNQYMVFAYDSSYGNLKSILDPNGFETISGWTKSTVTVDGFSYYVYVANSATTDTSASFTFKY